MAGTIDDKVVAMSFDNKKFEEGVKTTINSLGKLKASLQFPNSSRGIENVSRAFGHFQLGKVGQQVDNVSNKLRTMHLVGIGVLANLSASAVRTGLAFAKNLAFGPLIAGLNIYQTKLQAIQTILANTGAAGTSMNQVTGALAELNKYANLTIYSFGEMTRNIGTFTAAGVALKPAVQSIKGIANLAALSGSNSQQASTAMYQLSQAISAGQVHLQDWNSVVNAGMGGAVFQRALATTAQAMGTLKDGTVKLVGPMKNVKIAGESFRQSLQAKPGEQSWLTSDVLTKTLATFTGDMTDAQLAATGFTKAQIKSIQAQAKTALNAATQVKTFSQLMDVTKETIATGWASSFEIVIGNLTEAKKLFTGISNTLSNVVNAQAAARNKILNDWKELGGRTALINGLKNIFQAFGKIATTVKSAFREIFPRETGKQLYDLTKRFENFTNKLTPSKKTLNEVGRIFKGIFSVLDIGKQIIVGVLGVFGKLIKSTGAGSGGFLSFAAKIGDFLTNLDQAIKKGGILTTFFNRFGKVAAGLVGVVSHLAHAIAGMFSGFAPTGFGKKINKAANALHPFKAVVDATVKAIQGLGPAIHSAITNINWEAILQVIRTGLLAGLFLMVRKFIGGTTLNKTLGLFGNSLGKGFAARIGGGIMGNLSKTFGSLGGTLKSMQAELKARTLKEIAEAIALLALSLLALSLVKPKRLNSSLAAMAIAMAELVGLMMAIDKITTKFTPVKLATVAVGLVLLAGALDLLVIAIYAMSKLSFKELIKGLIGLEVVLVTVVKTVKALSENEKGIVQAAIAIGILAIGINLMAHAVASMGTLDFKTLIKGLLGLFGVLKIIAETMKIMPEKGMLEQAAAITVLGVGLNILYLAVKHFGNLGLKELAKGLGAVTIALRGIGWAMKTMPKGMVQQAIALTILSIALESFAKTIGTLGGMSIGTLAKGIISMSLALDVLAVSLEAMTGAIPGAIALSLAAVGLALLAPAVALLGKQSWGTLLKGIIGLAAAMGIIAGVALVFTEAIPALIGFGAALVLIGGGLALAGAGIFLIGAGLSAIAIAGPAAVDILIHALMDLEDHALDFAKNLVLGVLEIVKMLAKTAPQFVAAILKIIDQLATAIIKSSPKIAEALVVVIVSGLAALDRHMPEIVMHGLHILEALIQGIDKNLDKLTDMVANLIVHFLNALSRNIEKIERAGGRFVAALALGALKQIGRITLLGVKMVVHLVSGITNNLNKLVGVGTKAIVKFVTGVGNAGVKIVNAATKAVIKFATALESNSVKMVNAGFKLIIKFINGIADAIEKNKDDLRRAGQHLAFAIADGMTLGLASKGKSIASTAKKYLVDGPKNVVSGVYGWLTHSPSKWTTQLGAHVVQGFINGITNNGPNAVKSMRNLTSDLKDTLQQMSLIEIGNVNPTITPVIDLTEVRKGAGQIAGILGTGPIGTVSLGAATSIAAQKVAIDNSNGQNSPAGQTVEIKYEQNNYSPKALTDIEIYRRTRNQLSLLRSAINPIGGLSGN